MRTFLIPGLGEEISIFDRIEPFIQGEKLFIENWALLAEVHEKELTALVYAKYLIRQYEIKKEDVVIGHSMGGWVALYIKQVIGCRIIQIASWTDCNKVFKVPINRRLMYFLAKKGVGFNYFTLRFLVWLHYRNKPSKEIFVSIFKRLKRGDKQIVAKQLMVIFNPVKEAIDVTPDLRIHAKADRIVKYPDEKFYLVPGDHFSLYTYSEKVGKPIEALLNMQLIDQSNQKIY